MDQIKIKNIFLHIKKICIHKYWVAYYCFKCGLYWQGIMHDLSKFSFTEFWESVKYYQGNRSPLKAVKEDKGYSLAWLHHKGRNKHHYEYWSDDFRLGVIPIQMPCKYATELICDYLGAARAYLGSAFTYKGEYEWFLKEFHDERKKIHNKTKQYIDDVLYTLSFIEKHCIKTHTEDQIEKMVAEQMKKKMRNAMQNEQ